MKLPARSRSNATRPTSRRKYVHIILWSIVVLLTLVAILIALYLYDAFVGFGAPAHPNFMGYKPTRLPNGIRVTGQSLVRQHITSTDIWNFYYGLDLSNNSLTISEELKDNAVTSTISCYDLGGYCATYRTPKGYTYRVWYNDDNNKPSDMVVDWIKGNTDVNISVNDAVATQYLMYNWSPVLDSMHPVDLRHTPYVKYDSCQCGG
ncbi:MAG TPA: hypothetical protein VMB52_05400 [Verrucomicrobiae bacterium]|nr:hypothetical protein [Verrucomicrobiae bacterium]